VPYKSKQIHLGPDIEIVEIHDIKIQYDRVFVNGKLWSEAPAMERTSFMWMAGRDGLSSEELYNWFQMEKGIEFNGQIICWTPNLYS